MNDRSKGDLGMQLVDVDWSLSSAGYLRLSLVNLVFDIDKESFEKHNVRLY